MAYLHLGVVFKASNLNYGERVGNILSLKKITSNGKNYSYISRQAIRYDIVRMLKEMFHHEPAKVRVIQSDEQSTIATPSIRSGLLRSVIQFDEQSTIDKYPEIDFFGYMKTKDNTKDNTKIRKACVRLTDAVSLEPFNNETDFGTNKGLADRIPNNVSNDIFQPEIHRSYYSYTITCNLEDIGEDPIYEISLSKEEKSNRMKNFLDVIKLLYRDIRGKRENLSPVFVIGGIYDVGNPFFYNRIKLSFTKDKTLIDAKMINAVLKITTLDNKTVGSHTLMGYIEGEFNNIESIDLPQRYDIENFFKTLKEKIEEHYNR